MPLVSDRLGQLQQSKKVATQTSVSNIRSMRSVGRTLLNCGAHRPLLQQQHSVLRHPLPHSRHISRAVPAQAAAPTAPAVDAEGSSTEQQPASRAYPFPEIEAKWQQYWEEYQTFRTPEEVDTSKPKYYVLDMFPYPR